MERLRTYLKAKTNTKNIIFGNNFHETSNIQVDVNLADRKAELERL